MIRISLLACLVMTLSACSFLPFGFPGKTAPTSAENSLIASHNGVGKLVAMDLVNVLSQIDMIEPSQTTLYANRPTTRFGERLVQALQDSGYRLRISSGETEPQLSYNIEPTEAKSNYTVIVTAGLVKVKRQYHVDNAKQIVMPVSSIFVLGANGDNIELDDSRFADQQSILLTTANTEIKVSNTRVATATAVPPKTEVVKLPLENVGTNIAKNANLKPSQKFNMYDTRRSNFDELLSQYNTVRREVMVFPNDSLVMGVDNKHIAHEIAAQFEAESDVVSVIGCSHGRSQIEDGNRTLANGRADRVREELLLAGIESDLVLHEACWANVHFDEQMPRRGVVVTHKRQLN